MVDREDILPLYGLVTTYFTTYFNTHEPKGFGLFLLGDLHVLNDSSYASGKGFHVWGDQKSWKIVNWKYYPLPHVHMIYTLKGKATYMWADVIYPLTIGTLKQML